jgi:FdhD protein
MMKKQFQIHKIRLEEQASEEKEDYIAADAPICIFINNEYFRTLIASPNMTEELVVGHLLSEGIASSYNEIECINITQQKVCVELGSELDLELLNMSKVDLITTACGSLSTPVNHEQLGSLRVPSRVSVGAQTLWEAARSLNLRSETYRATGGTHSAMLYSLEGETQYFAEDVGRHNAVDKVIGAGAMKGIGFGNTILVSSGRLSGEITLKAARMGIPIIASVSSPLESGIRIAEATGITMVGFIRGRRMNVYTNQNLITV